MKLVTLSVELFVDDDVNLDDKEEIAQYLNEKLYMDPEFFGEFGPENIVKTQILED